MILYLIKFIACSAILMLLFHFLLAKEKTFCLNRWVLLLLIPVSMLIPLINIPILLPQESQVQISYLELGSNEPQEEISITPSSQAPSHHYWFPGLYLLVFFLLLISKLYAQIDSLEKFGACPGHKGSIFDPFREGVVSFQFW